MNKFVVASLVVAVLMLGLMVLRGVFESHPEWLFSKFYDVVIIGLGCVLVVLIVFNPEYQQPPSRLFAL
ncbi:MAG: hypothetical protein MJE12_03380 [Alphaproteobacteria bacterium]|nr:hypothetical protein [Alphaproteobacteria bacterium]